MTMLIVDDNPKMRRLIRSAVADLADGIYEGTNGAEAIALHVLHEPDWLVIDIAMLP